MQQRWQQAFRDGLPPEIVQWDEQSLENLSKDYHTFSPILTWELEDKIAQCVVSPRTDEELDAVLALSARTRMPLTVRGGGTGNYGQCVPLTGGILLNLSKYQKILEIGDGWMRVQSGAKLGRMETAAREKGFELKTLPSTFQSATIGGFLAGGFGGIGSIRWGTIWDQLVRSLTIKTVEEIPRTFHVEGDAVLPYLHTYGTIGVIAEVELNLAPRVEWRQWALSFTSFESAYCFAEKIAQEPSWRKRLVSVIDAPITRSFLPLELPGDRPVVFLEVDDLQTEELRQALVQGTAQVERTIGPEAYHVGIGVSDFSWNHTTLWARKKDPRTTYLQVQYPVGKVLERVAEFRKRHPEMLHHLEFAQQRSQIMVAGLPLMPFTGAEDLEALMRDCNDHGLPVANPHTADLEAGGRSYPPDQLWILKHQNDPFELLNQKKLRAPDEAPSRHKSLEHSRVGSRLTLQVTRIRAQAKGVLSVELRSPDTSELPPFEPGAHLGLYLPNGLMRQYSLLNDSQERHRYVIGVGLKNASQGGSRYIHSSLRWGDLVEAEVPQSLFPLSDCSGEHVFLAGGIGVTPFLSMVRRCTATKKRWKLIYLVHSRLHAAFVEDLERMDGGTVIIHGSQDNGGKRIDLEEITRSLGPEDHLYCCGPTTMMLSVKRAMAGKDDQASFEWFGAPDRTGEKEIPNEPFMVTLRKTGVTVPVAADETLLEALEDQGLDVPFFCRSGICRSCETGVCSGEIDHRDFVLSDKERDEGKKMMICVSRARGAGLELDL